MPVTHRAIVLRPASIALALCAGSWFLCSSCDRGSPAAATAASETGAGVGTPAPGKTEKLPLVRVEPLEVRTVLREVDATGHVESRHVVDVHSKVSERVLEVLV